MITKYLLTILILILIILIITYIFYMFLYKNIDLKYQLNYYLNNKMFTKGNINSDCPKGCVNNKCKFNRNCYECTDDNLECCCNDKQCET